MEQTTASTAIITIVCVVIGAAALGFWIFQKKDVIKNKKLVSDKKDATGVLEAVEPPLPPPPKIPLSSSVLENESSIGMEDQPAIPTVEDTIQLADDIKARGNDALKRKEYPVAAQLFSEAISLSANGPNLYIYFANRGLTYLRMGDLPAAKKDCEEALSRNPDYVKAYAVLGEVQCAQNDFQAAIASYERAVALDPEVNSYKTSLQKTKDRLQSLQLSNNKPAVIPIIATPQHIERQNQQRKVYKTFRKMDDCLKTFSAISRNSPQSLRLMLGMRQQTMDEEDQIVLAIEQIALSEGDPIAIQNALILLYGVSLEEAKSYVNKAYPTHRPAQVIRDWSKPLEYEDMIVMDIACTAAAIGTHQISLSRLNQEGCVDPEVFLEAIKRLNSGSGELAISDAKIAFFGISGNVSSAAVPLISNPVSSSINNDKNVYQMAVNAIQRTINTIMKVVQLIEKKIDASMDRAIDADMLLSHQLIIGTAIENLRPELDELLSRVTKEVLDQEMSSGEFAPYIREEICKMTENLPANVISQIQNFVKDARKTADSIPISSPQVTSLRILLFLRILDHNDPTNTNITDNGERKFNEDIPEANQFDSNSYFRPLQAQSHQQPVATLAHPHLISPSIACTDPNEVLRSPIQFQGWLKILDGNIVNDVYEGSWQLAYFSLRTPWLIMSERPNSEPCGVLDLRKCHSVRACFAKGGFLHDPFMFVDCFQIGYRGTDNRIIFAVADLDHFSKDWIGALGTAIVKLSSTFVDDDSDGNEDDDEDVNVSMSMIPPFFQSPRQNVSMRAAKSLAIKSEWLMIFNPSMGGWWQRLFCVLDSSKFLVAKSESSNVEGEFPLSSIQRFSTFKTENKNTFEIVNNQKEVLLVDAGSVAALNGWMGTLALALLTVNSASRQGNNVTLNDDPPHNVPANSKASNTNQTATNEISGAEDANRPKILSVSFNQDAECFTCGASNGFIVYNIDPFCEVLHCSPVNNDGGIRIVEMLHRTNLFALVGDDHNALHPNNMLKIWDHQQQKSFVELQFRSEVKAVKLRRDRVIVALDNEVYVYRLHDFHLLNRISTAFNPEGLFSVCSEAHGNMLAIPGEIKGSISIINLDDAAIQQTTPIHAYAENEDLAQFTLSSDGSLIASTSTEGSSIHIWNCRTGELIREFCTGCDGAVIYSLVFNAISTLIACCSDAGPIRIFSLIIGDSNETLFSQCDVNASSRPICAFSKDSSKLIVISQNGSMMVTRVGEDECVQISTTTYWK